VPCCAENDFDDLRKMRGLFCSVSTREFCCAVCCVVVKGETKAKAMNRQFLVLFSMTRCRCFFVSKFGVE
jgi:hypothetical protein